MEWPAALVAQRSAAVAWAVAKACVAAAFGGARHRRRGHGVAVSVGAGLALSRGRSLVPRRACSCLFRSGQRAADGASARGVDWADERSQELRFTQLLRIAEGADSLDVLDYGCGYAALVDRLTHDGRSFAYLGYDISPSMIDEAKRRHAGERRARFTPDADALEPCAYVVASGVFNVRLDVPDEEWSRYVLETIERLDKLSTHGFAFNALTSYSDPDKLRADLWYADPLELFDLCKRNYSRHVALLHDYGLWEFTLLVRKDV